MSLVPPSPATATQLMPLSGILPFFTMIRNPASTPEAVAATFSNNVCIQGTLQEVTGSGEVQTSVHPVALAIITFLPNALQASLNARASPQPVQKLCPSARNSSAATRFLPNLINCPSILTPLCLLPCLLCPPSQTTPLNPFPQFHDPGR